MLLGSVQQPKVLCMEDEDVDGQITEGSIFRGQN